MYNPTNKDLEILLARIEERQIYLIKIIDGVISWQDKHLENDHKQINNKLSNLQKYALSIAIVSSFITYMWKKITGNT